MHLLSLFSIFLSGSAAIAAPSLEKSQIAIQVDDTHKAPSVISDHDPKPLQLGPPLPENSPRGDLDEAFYLEVSFDDPARRGANSAFYGFSASHWGAHGELGYESIFRLENKRLVHEGFEVAYSPLRLLPYMTALNFAPDSHADFDFQVVPHEVGGKTVHYLEFLVPGRRLPFISSLSHTFPSEIPENGEEAYGNVK